MYVKRGSEPTEYSYDCRPYLYGNYESCEFSAGGGTYHVMVVGFTSYSNTTLVGSYTVDPDLSYSNLSADTGAWTSTYWIYGTDPTFRIYGGTGDADLYVKLNGSPSSSSFDCRPYLYGNHEVCSMTGTGWWYVRVNGYSAASGFTLDAVVP